MQVHYSNDEYSTVLFRIQNSVWKPPYQRSSYIVFDLRPSLWKHDCSLDGGMNLQSKVISQARLKILIIINGLIEFLFRLRVE